MFCAVLAITEKNTKCSHNNNNNNWRKTLPLNQPHYSRSWEHRNVAMMEFATTRQKCIPVHIWHYWLYSHVMYPQFFCPICSTFPIAVFSVAHICTVGLCIERRSSAYQCVCVVCYLSRVDQKLTCSHSCTHAILISKHVYRRLHSLYTSREIHRRLHIHTYTHRTIVVVTSQHTDKGVLYRCVWETWVRVFFISNDENTGVFVLLSRANRERVCVGWRNDLVWCRRCHNTFTVYRLGSENWSNKINTHGGNDRRWWPPVSIE